jgi:hypothetical protein
MQNDCAMADKTFAEYCSGSIHPPCPYYPDNNILFFCRELGELTDEEKNTLISYMKLMTVNRRLNIIEKAQFTSVKDLIDCRHAIKRFLEYKDDGKFTRNECHRLMQKTISTAEFIRSLRDKPISLPLPAKPARKNKKQDEHKYKIFEAVQASGSDASQKDIAAHAHIPQYYLSKPPYAEWLMAARKAYDNSKQERMEKRIKPFSDCK